MLMIHITVLILTTCQREKIGLQVHWPGRTRLNDGDDGDEL